MSEVRNGLFVDYCAKDFLDGTQMLDPWEELAYRRIVDMIYATNDRLMDDDRKIAWMTKTGNRWPRIKAVLLEQGKIDIIDGHISNARCRKTLEKSARKIAQSVGAGQASAATGKSLKNLQRGRTDVPSAVGTDARTNYRPNVEEDKSSPTRDVHQTNFRREFETVFWPAYPVKSGKKPALGAFLKARERDTLEAIMAGVDRYKRTLALPNAPNPKMAQGWLNDERWKDEDYPIGGSSGRQLGNGNQNGRGSLTPVESLFAGFALALDDDERQQEGHCREDFDPSEPLLDRRGQS